MECFDFVSSTEREKNGPNIYKLNGQAHTHHRIDREQLENKKGKQRQKCGKKERDRE